MGDTRDPRFAEFADGGSGSSGRGPVCSLTIRRASEQDADVLGAISARREGGSADEQAAAFRRFIGRADAGERSLVLLAEIPEGIIGFGKARHLDRRAWRRAGLSPEGWYLTGVVVDPEHRRRGAGSRLTLERLRWLARRSDCAYYFANARNRVSIALHERFGFVEVGRAAFIAGTSFEGGEGILFRSELTALGKQEPRLA
ncbi:MAG: GNAT family N-acetyltransferase [Candidatus Eisenbacteria bacterium]